MAETVKLHDYQGHAANEIIRKPGVGLFLDMGLGKTISTLMAVSWLNDRAMIQRTLIVAPPRVAEDTWPKEVVKWAQTEHLRVVSISGSPKKRLEALKERGDLYIISLGSLKWLIDELGPEGWFFDTVVLDEASAFKSPESQRFKAMASIRPCIKRLIALTGTPAPNSLLDIWGIIYLLDGGQRLGRDFETYRATYFEPDKQDYRRGRVFSWKLRPGMDQVIYEAISDITVSMKARDYLEMPPLFMNKVHVTMNEKEQKLYNKLKNDLVLEFQEGDVVAENASGLATKLLQLANGQAYNENQDVQLIHKRKVDALQEIIDGAGGQPILVFYNFKHDLLVIEEYLKGYKPHKLGGTEDVTAWNNGEIPLLLAHPRSAGHGLNLQHGGHIVVWFGLTYSLEAYEQANARLYRQGQKFPVVIHHIINDGTIDDEVMEILRRKEVGQAALMNAVKADLGIIR